MPPRKSRASASSTASESAPAEAAPKQSKGKAKAALAATEQEAAVPVEDEAADQAPEPAAEEEAAVEEASAAPALTMEERMEKMKALRQKMSESTKANRKAVAAETKRGRSGAGGSARDKVSWKLKKAEAVLDERDAKERGDDPERLRNWEYSIEQNERWEEKLEEREVKRDKGDIDPLSAAERAYQRKVAQIKPDLAGYAATRGTSGAPNLPSGSSSALTRRTDAESSQVIRRADVPQGSGNLSYGGHKPDEAAIDRVIGHLNTEADIRHKRSRQRDEDDDDPVTYINDKNKHFNKKLARAFGDATKGIRDNFERGTAL